MGIEINLKPEDAVVRETLIKEGLGEAIKEGVKKALGGHDNCIDKAVRGYVLTLAEELLRTKYADQVRDLFLKAFEVIVKEEFLSKVIDRMVRGFRNELNEYVS